MPSEPTRNSITPAATRPDGSACVAAVLVAAAMALGGSIVAFAADIQQGDRTAADCAATPGAAPTTPSSGPSSGTAAGGEGSTGWTGGTGGSYVGTTPGAPTPSSPTDQPATATGVNPDKSTTGSNASGC